MPGNDVKWLTYFCVEQNLADQDLCRQICNALGDQIDVLLFAETLIANDICSDKELLQQVIDKAWQKAQGGLPPPRDYLAPHAPAPAPAPPPTASPPPGTPALKRLTPEAAPSHNSNDEATEEVNTRPLMAGQVAPGQEHRPVPRSDAEVAADRQNATKKITLPPPSGVVPAAPPKPTPPSADILPSPSPPATEAPPPPQRKPLRVAAPPPPPPQPVPPPPQPAPPQPVAAAEAPVAVAKSKAPPSTPSLQLGFDISAIEGKTVDFSQIGGMTGEQLKLSMVKLLMGAQEMGASDVHLSADARPFVRLCRRLEFVSDHILTAEESLRLNCALLSPDQKEYFLERQDFDFALALDQANRYRVNLMIHKDGAAGTYRLVPNRVRSLEELGFNNAATIRALLDHHNGLILVTGPVGSGKTTTMASLVAELNEKRRDHIITVENPIEIVQRSGNCNITQREVGSHTESFHNALKGALREDPDIIVIGELRDLETIEMAITAAETGHLVIGTLHTADAATTLNRLLDVFPPAQQPQIRAMTAESLRGIICQRLLPSIDGGLVVACELLLNNLAVSNLIRENKAHALRAVLETGSKQGMCMMDNYILSLWQQGKISEEAAQKNIVDRAVRNRISSQKQFGDAGAQAVQTSLPGERDKKKKWGLFN